MVNYFAGLGEVEKPAALKVIRHNDLFDLHPISACKVMAQGVAGRCRPIAARGGNDVPPNPDGVSGLMFELLDWWSRRSDELSRVLSSAILPYRFEAIHPFAAGNGRTGRTLPLWELYRRAFDPHHLFSINEY